MAAFSLPVVAHLGLALPPKAHSPLLGFFPKALELAAVGVGEGGRASQSQLDQLLVEEKLVLPVTIGVQVDVGKGSPVGILGVSDAWDLQPNERVRKGSFRVAGSLFRLLFGRSCGPDVCALRFLQLSRKVLTSWLLIVQRSL